MRDGLPGVVFLVVSLSTNFVKSSPYFTILASLFLSGGTKTWSGESTGELENLGETWWKPWLSVIIKLFMAWLSNPLIIRLFPYLDYHESVILQKTSLKGLILIIKSTYQGWCHALLWDLYEFLVNMFSRTLEKVLRRDVSDSEHWSCTGTHWEALVRARKFFNFRLAGMRDSGCYSKENNWK